MTTPTRHSLDRRTFLSLAAVTGLATACGVPDTGASSGGRLKAATYIPPSYRDLFPPMQRLLSDMRSTGNGSLDFQMFHSETLLSAEQLISGLLQGVADLVFTTSSYISSSYQILGAYQLPFVNEGPAQNVRALRVGGPLYETINAELGQQELRLVASMPTALEAIWTVDQPIRKPSDAEGLRLRTAGEVEGETVKALGASPVSMSSAEVYQALERGTIDGLISYPGTVISRDLQQVLRYGTMAHFGAYAVDAYVRKSWFDEQPADAQTAMLDAGRTYLTRGLAHQLRVHEQQYFPAMRRAGMELFEPAPADLAAFQEAVGEVEQWWRGALGDQQLADRALSMVKQA